MRHFCRLCGARADDRERLSTYCAGSHCGTDLYTGDRIGVQAWCEPERQRGEPEKTASVRLVVRNSGARPDTFRVEPVERVHGRLDFDASVLNAPLAPDQTRVVEVRYTLPRDHTGLGIDVASRFGVPGADAAGHVNNGRGRRFGVALRVVSTTAGQGAACAAFAVDVPARHAPERPDGRARRRSVPLMAAGAVLALVVVIAVVAAFALNGGDSGTAASPNGSSERARATGTGDPAAVPGEGTSQQEDNPRDEPSKAARPGTSPPGSPGAAGGPTAGRTVVPNTVTLDVEQARRMILDKNLVPRVVVQKNSKGPRNEVSESSPPSGRVVDEGSTVTIQVRDGNTVVPNVLGLDQDSALAALRDAGLTATFTKRTTSDAAKYDTVVETFPAAGVQADIDTAVTVHVGKPDIR